MSDSPIKPRVKRLLREALVRRRPDPDIVVDRDGYVGSFTDNLLPLVSPADFEADLRAGAGGELKDGKRRKAKFRAVHSSMALAVNCFAPFRRTRIDDLTLPFAGAFSKLEFERKCPIGLQGAHPHLDVLLSGADGVVGVESKLIEYFDRHRAKFSPAYDKQIRDERCEQGYFKEMSRLKNAHDSYARLDVAQLIKHAFGLARTFSGRNATLLYLYWEPANPDRDPVFADHRREIAEFADRVAGSTPRFKAMSYPELWAEWRTSAPAWLSEHLGKLAGRYAFQV